MPTPVPANLLPQGLRAAPAAPKAVPADMLPEGLRPQKEAAGFFGSLMEGAQTLGITDEAAAFAADPSEKNRRALIKAGESKFRQVGFGEGENWEAFKQLLGGSIGQLAAPVAAGVGASFVSTPIGGLAAASTVSGAQYTSQNLLRQAQEQEAAIAAGKKPEDTSVGKAILAATGQTALDVAGGKVFTGIAKAFPFMKPLLGQAGGKAAQEAGEVLADAAANGTIKFTKGIATGVGKGIAFEVPQEIAQQGLERWQAGLSLADDEAQSEYGQAALGALLLGGGFGGVSGALSTRSERAEAKAAQADAEAEAEGEATLPEILPTTGVKPEAVRATLAEAAGPELSRGANAAVDALSRTVSNALATGRPEDVEAARSFIAAREDDIAAGTKYTPDIAEPYTGALVQARQMLDEVAPVEEVTPVAEVAPVAAAPDLTSVYEAPNMEARKAAALDVATSIVESLPGIEATSISKKVYNQISTQIAQQAARGETFDPVTVARATLAKNGVEVLEAAAVPEVNVSAAPELTTPEFTPQSYVDRYMAGEGRGTSTADLEMQQYAANNAPEIEAEFNRRTQQETPDAGTGRPTTSIDEGVGVSVPPSGGPEVVGAAPSGVSGVGPEAVGVGGVPPVPPTVGPDAEPSPLTPEPTPEPTLEPQRTPLNLVPNWLARTRRKLADSFEGSKALDTWMQSSLGYETLPEEFQTAAKLETLQTQQAGKSRNLQRDFFDPIIEMTGKLGVDLGDLGLYLWARSAPDRNRDVAETNPENFPEGGSGLTTAQASEILAKFKEEGKLAKLNQVARKADALVDFTLAERVKAGKMSQAQADAMRAKQKYYMPLKGFAKDGDMLTSDLEGDTEIESRQAEAMRALRAAAPGGTVNEIRQAFGRGSMPFHPLFNLFQDAEATVRSNVENQAMRPIIRAWKKDPSIFEGILNVYTKTNPKRVMVSNDTPGGRWEAIDMEKAYRNSPPGTYTLIKDNGANYYVEFAEQGAGADLKRMFANMRPEQMKGALKTLAIINNFMKGMLTYKNPLYLMFVAPFRDTSAAIATAMANQNLKGSPAFGKNLAARTFLYSLPFSGTGSAIGRYVFGKAPLDDATSKQLQEMIDAGGAPLQTRFLNVEESASVASRAIRAMKGLENLPAKERPAKLWEGLNQWVDGLADVMDLNARFATYRAATHYGIEPADAARLALDSSLNLTRRGEMARGLDLIFPFFGAGVESTRKTLRIASNPRALTKVFGGMIAVGVMESIWNAMQAGDADDDGQEDHLDQDLGAGLRASRFIIYYGDGPDDYTKIPIDPMLGYFKFVGNKIGDVMAGAIAPSEATTGLVSGFTSLMLPTRIPGTDVQSVGIAMTPLVGKPFMENIINRNFFGSPIYKERTFDSAPRSELGRETTGDFWKGLAKTLNSVTGGSAAVSGGMDFQPEVYRHFIESYFGGPYQLAKQMVGIKEAEGMADIPGIKSFVGTGSEYAPQTKYYENSSTVRQIMNRLSKLTPEQQMAQGAEFYMDTDPRIMDAYKAVEANLDRINKEQKASMALAKTDEEEKAVLDYYRGQKNEYYAAFNSVYNGVKKEQ